MSENIENKVGLQRCFWKENDKLFSVPKGGTYKLFTNNRNEFFVDEKCVGGKTENPKETVNKAKWAFIYDFLFQKLEKAKQEDISENLWGPLSGGNISIAKYGLGTKYKQGSSLIFNPTNYSYYYGYKQRVELFSQSPGTGFYFYIIPVDKPKISFAYFTKSEEVKHYGESVSLQIMLHAYNLDEKNKYKAKLYLLEEDLAKGLTETDDFEDNNLWNDPRVYTIANSVSGDDWNSYINVTFPIDIEWKKNQLTKKNFTVVLEVYKFWEEPGKIYGTNYKEERVNYKNYADNPTTDLVEYDPTILGLKDVDNKKSISSRFIVSEELMDHYLERIEQEKNNMIQYIGDIEYKQREFDPCGYSKITVKDEDDKDRESFVIFDETATVGSIDKTKQSFSVITGDTRKKVSITLDQLTTQDTFCQGLLLDNGQKHSVQKNVFQVDKVYAALKSGNDHVRQADTTHQEQQRNAGVATTNENKNDTDVVKTKNSYNASVAQQWKEGVDYKIDSNEKITLMLRYIYNKTAFESTQKEYLGKTKSNELINSLWLFRYFLLTEDKVQTYFLPISTCRYPNQIAKINIYPEMEWEVAFLMTIGKGYTGKLKYSRERLNQYHQNFSFRYLRSDLQIEGTETSNLGWVLKAKAVENGNEHEVGIESIKKIVDTAVFAFNATRQGLEVFDPVNSDGTPSLAQSRRVIDIDFAIDPPNIGFALGWKFGKASNNEIVPIYTGGLRADPLIGITVVVDLVPLVKFIPYVGNILSWLIRFVERITKSKIYITFEITVPVKADLSLSYNKVDGFTDRSKQKMWMEPGIVLRAGCKSNEVVFIPTATRSDGTVETTETEKWKIEGNAAASYTFEKEWGYDKQVDKYYEQSTIKFNGAKITIVVSELISKRRIDFKPYKQETFEVVPADKPDEPTYSSGKIYIENEK
ncbi:hypothetical protein [Chryseobacterium sp. M5A1_1a]